MTTLYMVLFSLGFILAVCLLAYVSMQVKELDEKAEQFAKNLQERYSKPLTELEEIIIKKEEETKNA